MKEIVSIEKIKSTLENARVIAVVGLSPKESRPSNMVARYLLDAGYTVVPVNPGHSEILGQSCYASVSEIPFDVDIVDIFRNPADVVPIIDEAVAKGVGCVWMQLGIVNENAAKISREHGIFTIMDRCLKIDHQQLL